jgi:hypothetical protein
MRGHELGLRSGLFQVPVIAVFTKYDQFKREISFKLEDKGRDLSMNPDDETKSIFRQYYLAGLGRIPPFVRLESEKSVLNYQYRVDLSLLQECTSMVNRVLILLK